MEKQTIEEKVNHFFTTHPDAVVCFNTSDEFIFHKREDATAHSFGLSDKTVKENRKTVIDPNLVSSEAGNLADSIEETKAVREAKDEETLQTITAGLQQRVAEDGVSELAQKTVAATIDQVKQDVPTGTDKADDANQADKNAAALVGAAAAEAGADLVKTTVTPTMVDFKITKAYLAANPKLKEEGKKVGDTIKVPAAEL